MDFRTEDVRNVAIAGHGQTGKTTMLEHLLYIGKAISTASSVEAGKTVSDNTQEEISHHISIYSTLSHIEWKNREINIWDTPGSSDFTGEVISSFRSSEMAVMLIDAKSGAQIETIKLWRDLDRRNKPRIVFLNHIEDAGADTAAALKDIHDKFKVEVCPVTIPMGTGNNCKGVIDIIHGKAYFKPNGNETEKPADIPDEFKGAYNDALEVLSGSAAEGDEDLLVKFIDEGTLTAEEIISGLRKAYAENKIVPAFAGIPPANTGLVPLLDFLAEMAPSPAQRIETQQINGKDKAFKISADAPFSALVVKTAGDQFSGKLSYIKVMSGTASSDNETFNISQKRKEKIGKLYRCIGNKLDEIKTAAAGDICIASKLSSTKTSDTLAADENTIPFKRLRYQEAVYSIAVTAKDKKSEDKMEDALSKISDTDRTVTFRYNAETKQNVLSGMGELQLNIILDKLKQTGIELTTDIPRIAYRETVQRKAQAEYTHKKQSGGHGQYAKVVLSLEPLPRGDDYKFTNAVFGGAISKNYIPGVEKGVKQAMEGGVLAGYPVVDVAVTVLDGKEHPVDSSDLAFQIAGRYAFRDAMLNAGAILLEPIMNVFVWVDTKYLGDIMSDLSSRRGRILGQQAIGGGIEEIRAHVPEFELLRYSIDLRAMTSATGSFETSFDHYDPVSGKTADTIIAEAKAFHQQKE